MLLQHLEQTQDWDHMVAQLLMRQEFCTHPGCDYDSRGSIWALLEHDNLQHDLSGACQLLLDSFETPEVIF